MSCDAVGVIVNGAACARDETHTATSASKSVLGVEKDCMFGLL